MSHFTDLVDLADERLGGAAVAANDDFFAPKENLVKHDPAVWLPDEYTDRGKWMDGWETRRKRVPGYDWCIVRLGIPGHLHGVVVDTAHFKGNYPESCSVEAIAAPADAAPESLTAPTAAWVEIVPRTTLQGDFRNGIPVRDRRRWTHVRLNVFPDGGVARLRVHGEPSPDWRALLASGSPIDLAALENGGLVLASSDQFFGSNQNLIAPGRARHMGEGWETKRSRRPGFDWTILKLAARGVLRTVEVDTNHFKGNYPDRFSLEVCDLADATLQDLTDARAPWVGVLPETRLQASTRHEFERELTSAPPATHVRLRIYPDGGVSRLRLWGTHAPRAAGAVLASLARWNVLGRDEAIAELLRCCGSRRWAEQTADRRPFPDPEVLAETADRIWWSLGPVDWREAFAAHPRLGDREALRKKFSETRAWAEGEQAGATAASEATLAALAEANRSFEEKFGHIFILCATGRSADEMLASLRERMEGPRETELYRAAEEQRRITRIRLQKALQA